MEEKNVIKTELFVNSWMLWIKKDEKNGKEFIITWPEVHTYFNDWSIAIDFPIQYL